MVAVRDGASTLLAADRRSFACLPRGLRHLAGLEVLTLRLDEGIRVLPASLGLCPRHSVLFLSAPAVAALPATFGRLVVREALVLLACPRLRALRALPAGLSHLLRLRRLELNPLASLGGLPPALGEGEWWSHLSLSRMPAAAGLPEPLGG